MKLKMAENSLFAILLRSPWWISIALAVLIVLASGAILPNRYFGYGAFAAIPFLVIGIIAATRQLRAPSAAELAATLQAVRAMQWREFSAAVEQAFRRDGYTVTRLDGAPADFEIVKSGRSALVSAKRWKAAGSGVEPLRELQAAAQGRDACDSIYLTAGELSDNARSFAGANGVRVIQGAELAQLLRGLVGKRNSAA